jgi:acyl carrier protein
MMKGETLMDDIRNRVMECVALVLRTDIENVTKLSGDQPLRVIGMDSLNVMDIIVNLEDIFNTTFNEEELLMENINTIDKLTGIIARKTA